MEPKVHCTPCAALGIPTQKPTKNYKFDQIAPNRVYPESRTKEQGPRTKEQRPTNYVDAALLMQEYPDIDAVATGMARALKGQEVQYMKDKGVKYVVVAMDNDLAGQASGEMRERLTQEWMQTHDAPPPEGAGHKTYKMLQAMGMGAIKLLWTGCPPKADIGWAIEQGVIHYVLRNEPIRMAA